MPQAYPAHSEDASKKRWERMTVSEKLAQYGQKCPSVSQRTFAKQNNIPRTNLQHWLNRYEELCQESSAAVFFESPLGLEWLQRIYIAALFVLHMRAGGGIRLVCEFLHLSGLSAFVAASYGSVRKSIIALEQAICKFGREERERLATNMPHRQLVLGQDETFHPAICLVALDLNSGFIFVERYATDRTAQTWNQVVQDGLKGLNVSVKSCVTDQARALVSHVEKGLGVHHSPDLFHIQQELVKANSLALNSQLTRAEAVLEKASGQVQSLQEQKRRYLENMGSRDPGRPPQFEQRIGRAQEEEQRAKEQVHRAQERIETLRSARKDISGAYHPVNLQNGELQDSGEIEAQLNVSFERIEEVAREAELTKPSIKRIAKARRLQPKMLETIRFFFQMVVIGVTEMKLTPELEVVFYRDLLAGFYIEKVSKQQSVAEERHRLKELAEERLAQWRSRDGPGGQLEQDHRDELEVAAKSFVHLFARASSATEGRNAHLERHHRSFHRLSERKLEALTVIHNYHIQREDSTTAAERFFGAPPQDLFEFLLQELAFPRRPAKRRPRRAS